MRDFNINLQKYLEDNPDFILTLQSTNHSMYSDNNANPYHLEHDVWTHTMMVVNSARTYLGKVSSLFHDAGKTSTASRTKKGYTAFNGHEAKSMFYVVARKEEIKKAFELSDEEFTKVLIAIVIHGRFWNETDDEISQMISFFDLETRNLIADLLQADQKGRISTNPLREYNFSKLVIPIPEFKFDETNPNCYFMVGIPGSGKSTMVEKLKQDGFNGIIISRDDILMDIVTYRLKDKNILYKDAWKYAEENGLHKTIDKILIDELNYASNSGKDVIIDMTNLTKKSRNRHLTPFRQKGYNTIAMVKLAPLSVCINNRKGDKSISSNVINDMAKKFTLPLADECDKIEMYFYE